MAFYCSHLKNIIPYVFIALCVNCSGIIPKFASCKYADSYVKGMNIFFMPPRNIFNDSDFTESLLRLQSDGINELFLVPYFFSQNEFSNTIDSTYQTIPDSQLNRAISLSKQHGFAVVIKPHIDLRNGVPRYKISPSNYPVWIENYKAFINRYIAMALNNGLNDFVIGTELDNVVDKKEFHFFCDSIRNRCPIRLIYAASYNHFMSTTLWDHVDLMGIDAYFNLDNTIPPSPNTLHETWNYWLNLITDVSSLKGKNVLLTEVGYFSRTTAAANPGTWSGNPAPDLEVQKECYEALLSQACNFDRIMGIGWWQWELGKIGGAENNDATPRDKPAEKVIRSYWAQ